MITGLLGKKIGMTQIFKEAGGVIPVTVIEAGPCVVLQVKSQDKDGYNAVQLGFDAKNEKSTNKPQTGRFTKINIKPLRFLREIRAAEAKDLKPADNIYTDIFAAGDYIDVTGTSIGKGFQGGMKRWNWKGGPKSHGSTSHRAPGSIGSSSDPSRVFKGHHLPGHMGNRRVTVQGLEVVEIDKDNNILVVKGAVPGKNGSYLVINKSFKKKKKQPKVMPEKKEEKKVARKEPPKPKAKK